MKKLEVLPGHEFRGFVVRLYPTQEQQDHMHAVAEQLRYAWNWLVKQVEDSMAASRAYAQKQGLVGARPTRPNFEGLSPDESKAAKIEYRSQCSAWAKLVYDATKKLPECKIRTLQDWKQHLGVKQDYQVLLQVLKWRYEAVLCEVKLLESVAKNYLQKSARRKTFKRAQDHIPLQTRSSQRFKLGDFGERRGKAFYNCAVHVCGSWVRGRLPGRAPQGRVLGGVAVTKQADGWYGSIKVEVPMRVLPTPLFGSVAGVDVGLKNLAAVVRNTGECTLVTSGRGRVFAERLADRQARGFDVGRVHQKAVRHTRHLIYNEIVKPLERVETIKIEELNSKIGQMGSTMVSSMRTIHALLRERYGARVVEVDPSYTSQDCSKCGHRDKYSWSYELGGQGSCIQCGHAENRDINAARNIMSRPAIYDA